MGTNYYARVNHCDKCGRVNIVHIGKSSFGWKFLWQGYPCMDEEKLPIKCKKDWYNFLTDSIQISNGAGGIYSREEFIEMVEKHNSNELNVTEHTQSEYAHYWNDEEGNNFRAGEWS